MKKRSLRFRSLDIHKMPGFPNGFRSYEDFHPEVNIIAGPNASGKSTTARALQHILWPELSKNVQLKAELLIGSEEWIVEKDLSRSLIQQEGEEGEMPARPVAEDRYRYMLALHDLVRVEDQQLAQLIIQESAGGYNLDQAADELGYSDHIPNRGIKVYQKFREASESYNQTYEKQSALKNRQRKLNKLREQLEEAEQAASVGQLIDLYQEYQQKKSSWKWQHEQLEAYPAGLAKASGDEGERLRELQNSIDDKQSEIEKLEREIEEAKESLSHIQLSSDGISDQKLDLLNERVDRLKSVRQKLDERENELTELKEKRQSASRSLNVEDENLDPRQIEALDLSKLEEWLQSVYKIKSRRQHKEEEIRQLEKANGEQVFERDKISEGLRLLRKWFSTASTSGAHAYPPGIFWGVVITGLLSALSIYVWDSEGLWTLLVPVALAVYALIRKSNEAKHTSSGRYIEEYRETGLPVPQQWDAEQVTETMNRLADELVKSRTVERKSMRLEQLKTEIKRMDESEWEELQEKQDEWKEYLQVLPDFLEGQEDTFGQFYWFLHRLNEWKEAQSAIESTRKAVEDLKRNRNKLLDKFDEDLSSLGIDRPNDAEEAASLTRDLERKERSRRELVQTIDASQKQMKQHRRDIQRLNNQAEQIYEKFELNEPDVEEIEQRLKNLESYKDARKKCDQAEYAMQQAQNALQQHPRYGVWEKELKQKDEEELEKLQNRYKQEAAKREDLRQEIQEIEVRVERVQEEHDLEEALQEKEEALNDLRNYYESNLESRTGDLLVNKLQQITREQNQPEVYKRAVTIFNRITNGQFRLLVDKKNQTFRAIDTIQNKGKDLEQLSTGTRIQLLMAVRLAFIETQEHSIKLPVMADEIIANSDEERGEAIIKALTQMSREGRQVFYFTAQADEVYKWKSLLERQSVGYRIFELGQPAGQGFAYYETYRPDRKHFRLTENVPEPSEGESHASYGRKLEVSYFNLTVDPVSQLHLWYLIEDIKVLSRCLTKRINHWGSLQSYLEHGGQIKGVNEKEYNSLSDLISWLKRFQDLYQQGRSSPIDREVLETTEAVTDNFIEEVAAKLKELDGDPDDLLKALREGEVSGFRSAKIDQLENDLIQKGYMDESEPLSVQEIRSRMQAYLDQLGIRSSKADRLLDRILPE